VSIELKYAAGGALVAAVWFGASVLAGRAMAAEPASPPLPVEELNHVATLPARYPGSWVLVDYIAAPSPSQSNAEIFEVGATGLALKGQVPIHEYGMALASPIRPEIYVAETFYARGDRGPRTDVLTVYETSTLSAVGEVVLPGAKRGIFVKQPASFALANGGRWGLVANFTPAASVTVVDLEARKVLSEVGTPGCVQIFPTGPRGFSSFCANGTVLSFKLDADGKVLNQRESAAFNQLDSDPAFLAPTEVAGVSYFPTFAGRVQPVDFRSEVPKILPSWDLTDRRLAAERWRPSGLQLAAGDGQRLYVLMRPNSVEGSHKEGGTEVWVFDPKSHARTGRIKLTRTSRSIFVTAGPPGRLLAIGLENAIDIYDPSSGAQVGSSMALGMGGGLMRAAQ